MGHMLERMHNVEDRDRLPQKRQKFYDNRQDGRKAEFNGGGKGGVLGDISERAKGRGPEGECGDGSCGGYLHWLVCYPSAMHESTD